MSLTRRSMFGLGAAVASVATVGVVQAVPAQAKQTFLKGQILPRYHFVPMWPSASGAQPVQVAVEYDIYDGSKFVAFNSTAGQKIVEDLT